MNDIAGPGLEASHTELESLLDSLGRFDTGTMSLDEIRNLVCGTPGPTKGPGRDGSTEDGGSDGKRSSQEATWLTSTDAAMVRRFDPRGEHSGFFVAAFKHSASENPPEAAPLGPATVATLNAGPAAGSASGSGTGSGTGNSRAGGEVFCFDFGGGDVSNEAAAAKKAKIAARSAMRRAAALQADLVRVASEVSEDDDDMMIFCESDSREEIRLNVKPTQLIHTALCRGYRVRATALDQVWFGEEPVLAGESFDDHGMEDGARLAVGLGRKATFPQVLEEILILNPNTHAQYSIVRLDKKDPSRVLTNLNWESHGLLALPESFGDLRFDGDLNLANNELTALPESFGGLSVGRNLKLSGNRLTRLPDGFGSIRVGRDLSLARNPWRSFPTRIGELQVGRDLLLGNLDIREMEPLAHDILDRTECLSAGFKEIQVGGRVIGTLKLEVGPDIDLDDLVQHPPTFAV